MLAFLFFCVSTVNAQLTDVVTTGVTRPNGMIINGNYLYISEYTGNRISKIDITATNPTVTNVIAASGAYGIALDGNDLYIAESSGNKISKIDITATNPTKIDVVTTGISVPTGLIIIGNYLYIAQDNGTGKISKIDITATGTTATDVIASGLGRPYGLAVYGNDLYIAEFSGNKVSKFDITATNPTMTDVVTGLNSPEGLVLNGNDLYIAELDGNKISKIDITATNPTATDVIAGLNGPSGLIFNGDDLYISEFTGNKISKYIDLTLSMDKYALENMNALKVYPNPTTNSIKITNLNKVENYAIYNVLGMEINRGAIASGEKINVQNFTNGIYFLKFDNGTISKFIKE